MLTHTLIMEALGKQGKVFVFLAVTAWHSKALLLACICLTYY